MRNALHAFQRHVMADPGLQRLLGACDRPDAFSARALAAAAGLGLQLAPEALVPRPRTMSVAPSPWWPPHEWLPVRIVDSDEGPLVDWAYFGDDPLTDSFFDETVRRVTALPINRVFRHVTSLDALLDGAPCADVAPLRGLVYHMSRCGSTLVAQMLGALPATLALSEPGPFDAAVRLAMTRADLAGPRGSSLLRAMVAALGRRRGGVTQCFLKLDSWHMLAFPLIQAAFPNVPWVYLFREPVEVLVSQMRMRGYQTVPALMPSGLYGLQDDGAGPEDLCARIFAGFHVAAIRALADPRGIAIDYAGLPTALMDRIAPHFGLSPTPAERTALERAGHRNAKAPAAPFVPDAARKRQDASAATLEAARRHLRALHAELAAVEAAAASSA
ncbi:hypothetical protein S2M10_23570 [Sphingomonas sp. S2M10]|nr:hypothetical protein [Sphingomonas sp. S2M10]